MVLLDITNMPFNKTSLKTKKWFGIISKINRERIRIKL